MDTVNGINEEELRSLCMEILDYSESIAEIFDKVDEKFQELGECYNASSYHNFMSSYNDFRNNYLVVKKNINSYSDDLIALVQRMQDNANYLANMFINMTDEKIVKAKSVRVEN